LTGEDPGDNNYNESELLSPQEMELINSLRELPDDDRYETMELIISILSTKKSLYSKKKNRKITSSTSGSGEEAASKLA
jgi:hypothetical protein